MAKYLQEDEAGSDPTMIGFPCLLLCQGVVCVMNDSHLIGGHFTDGATESAVAGKMKLMILANTSRIERMYIAYDSTNKPVNASDAQAKADLFEFHGDVFFFDTSSITPEHGTYVQITSLGPGHDSLVQFKRDEKMDYTKEYPTEKTNIITDAKLKGTATKMHSPGKFINKMSKI